MHGGTCLSWHAAAATYPKSDPYLPLPFKPLPLAVGGGFDVRCSHGGECASPPELRGRRNSIGCAGHLGW